MPDEDEKYVVVSPLERWPGEIVLPDPNDFDGLHWQTWRTAVDEKSKAGVKEVNRLLAYAGVVFVAKHGEWKIDSVSLDEFQSWQTAASSEKIRFVSWVGKMMQSYIEEITNPKG